MSATQFQFWYNQYSEQTSALVLVRNCRSSTKLYVELYVSAPNPSKMTMRYYSIFGSPGNAPGNNQIRQIDDDEETVQASENRSSKEKEMRELCLKWVFPMTGDKRKVLNSHHTILGMMFQEHAGLIVIDNKAREHTETTTMQPSGTNRPFDFYIDARNKDNRKLVCIHRIRSRWSLAELKESWGVLEELRKQKAYVRTHAFGEKDREISHIGFIPGIHISNTPREVVKEEILSMLRQENAEVPNFEIVQVRIDMGKGSRTSERTRAYEIQCPQKEASGLAKKLQSGIFQKQPIYVPYRLKKSDPKTFKNAIKRQIKVLSEQWVIKIRGFTPDMIQHAKGIILQSAVEEAVPTHNTALGEWKLLLHRKDYGKTMKWLQSNWTTILETIPQEMQAGSTMEEPRITSKNATTFETQSEDSSVDTYGTILSSLYYGTDQDDEVQSEVSGSEAVPRETTTPYPVTYAQVMKGNTSTVSQVSGWTENRNDEFVKLQEKHTALETKFDNVSAEIIELKHMIQQLLSQGQAPAAQEPPNKKQATFETPRRHDRRSPRDDTTMDMEHEPANQTGSETGKFQEP